MAGIIGATSAAQHRASNLAKLLQHIFSSLCPLDDIFHENLHKWMAYHTFKEIPSIIENYHSSLTSKLATNLHY